MIRVGFDLGGTLLRTAVPEFTPLAPADTAPFGLEPVEAQRHLLALFEQLAATEYEPGEHQTLASVVIEEYRAKNELRCTAVDLENLTIQLVGGRRTEMLTPLAGAPDLLRALREREVPTFALSNTGLPGGLVRRLLEHHGMRPLLGPVVLSSECGRRKPTSAAFDLAETVGGVAPGDGVIFVGDDPDKDIRPALARGHRAVWISDPAATDLDDLDDAAGADRLWRAADLGAAHRILLDLLEVS
ncbi:HAD family hydrolase [Nocardia takedensis]